MKITGYLLKPLLVVTMGVTSLAAPSIASAANQCGVTCTKEFEKTVKPDGSVTTKEKLTCTVAAAGC